jgi:predicted dehydrogenase
VSGDPAKAQALATLYGVPANSVYNYENYESMRENPDISAVYVVLPRVQANKTPYTPGEEGLQDHRLMEAIYESANTGKPVRLKEAAVSQLDQFRGSQPEN